MSPINGKPQPRKHRNLGGKKISGNGGKKGDGCLIALLGFGTLASGWLHMVATSAGWIA